MDSNSTYDPYDEIAETFEKLAPTSLQKLNQNSPSRYIDKNHFQQNVPDRTSSNLLKYEKHSTIPLQSFKSVYNASNHHNKKHGTCMKYFESIFPNTLEKKKFDFVKKRTKFLSVCNLHHSLNSLQSVHSYSVNDFTNIESGIEVSNSSIDFGGNDANFHSHSLKNYQHDITNTTYPLFGNDSYSNIDILSQLSDNDENDRFQNQSCFYMRCNSFPTSSHENQKRINMNKKDKQKFDEVLTTRSNSAPIVTKIPNDVFFFSNMVRCSRSQSGKNIAEIEALEACNWLKAAGFPQYASMFQENLFPIDLSTVAKDHPFLENDPLQSLYRRLVILNKCAKIRVELQKKTAVSLMDEESDDENCALSENWSFEPQIRRWSRIVEMGPIELNIQRDSDSKESSSDSRESSTERSDLSAIELLGFSTLPLGLAAHPSGTQQGFPNKFKRTGSEKLKHGAKALLKKVESIKAQRRKRHSSRKAIFMNEPGFLDITSIDECFQKKRPSNLKYSKSNPASPMPSSPIHGTSLQLQNSNFLSPIVFPKTKKEQSSCIIVRKSKDKKSGDETSHCSDSSQDSSGKSKSTISVKKPSRIKRFLQRSQPDECETLSDSECQITKENIKHEKTLSSIKSASNLNVPKPIRRGGSLNLGKESKDFNEGFQRKGFRSRSTLKSVKSKVDEPSNTLSIKKESLNRWHSFQKTERKTSFALSLPLEPSRRKSSISGVQLSAMSCGQLQVVRKLALVTLTGYMERYCPSHKSGWQHWELPKFIKKIKAPDYKDKKVFGVPILLTVQRTGHSLPLSIQGALKWLRLNAIECVGLFRKSGVKSRIAKLKWIVETSDDDSLSLFEGQLAYDVADMVKQYFRDLPESILTKKLTDTFLSIFKHGSMYNQMTSHNLAVCLAPSIFQNTIYSQRG
uniref:CSON002268 protein n=1 Tax=Culicoides sonorensis TaxID=179676 RepID=A0A336LWL9_CULSO